MFLIGNRDESSTERTMEKLFISTLLLTVLVGCHSLTDASEKWASVNKPDQSNPAHGMKTNWQSNKIPVVNAPTITPPAVQPRIAHSSEPAATLKLNLKQAIGQVVPSEYEISVDPDVNLNSPVAIDITKSWLDTLGQALSEANIELIVNLHKKTLAIKRTKITLEQAIEKLLPADFTVFSDANVNLQTSVYFDTRQYWIEAFSYAMADVGIDLTVNLKRKIISLRSIASANANEIQHQSKQ
jgi:hypothetical protein